MPNEKSLQESLTRRRRVNNTRNQAGGGVNHTRNQAGGGVNHTRNQAGGGVNHTRIQAGGLIDHLNIQVRRQVNHARIQAGGGVIDHLNIQVRRVNHARTQAGGGVNPRLADDNRIFTGEHDRDRVQHGQQRVGSANHNTDLHLSVEVEDLDFPVQVEDSG